MKTVTIIEMNKILVYPLENEEIMDLLIRLEGEGVITSIKGCLYLVNDDDVDFRIRGAPLKNEKKGFNFDFCLN